MQAYKSAKTKIMYIEKKSKRNKIILLVSIIVILLTGAGITYAAIQSNNKATDSSTREESSSKIDSSPVSEDQEREAGNQAKADTVNPSTSPSSSPQGSVAIEISASSQNGSVYQIRTLINAVVSDGECELTLTKGSSTVSKTAPVQSLAQASTCQGFDVPTSELSKGVWNAKISLSKSSVSGSVTSTIEIK